MNVRQRLFALGVAAAKLSEHVGQAFLYMGAGALRREDSRAMSARAWRGYAPSPEEIAGGLDPWEERAYLPWIKKGDRLCIVGAGTGRDVLPFVDAGHDVIAVEPAAEPAAILRGHLEERGRAGGVVQAYVEDAQLPGTFDVVIFSLNCYSYIHGSRSRVATLHKLADHLNPDGRILLSYRQRLAGWNSRALSLASLVSTMTRSDWRLEPYDAIRPSKAGGSLVYEHYFTAGEVEDEARRAGLRVHAHDGRFQPPLAVLGR